jgi:hypothetical protein
VSEVEEQSIAKKELQVCCHSTHLESWRKEPVGQWQYQLPIAVLVLRYAIGLTSCAGSPAGVRPAGAPLRCGRRGAGPRSTEQERGGKSVW